MPKISERIALHLPMGGQACAERGAIAPLALPLSILKNRSHNDRRQFASEGSMADGQEYYFAVTRLAELKPIGKDCPKRRSACATPIIVGKKLKKTLAYAAFKLPTGF